MIQRCRDGVPILDVSLFTGVGQWVLRLGGAPTQCPCSGERAAVKRMRALHAEHDDVIGSPRMCGPWR